MPHVVPVRPANPAPPAPHYKWPHGKSCALFLSFDVDAETAWTSKDPALAEHLVTMSFGGYEARVGVPMLLEMLRRLDLKATFFTTGWAADAHPAMCESILADGHEIGHHGYHHLMPDPADPAAMEEELDRGFDALSRRLGVVPTGYRAPFGESFEALRASLARRGMTYSSSWRDDVRPYRQVLADGTPGVIELPVTLSYDDWLYGLTNRHSPRPLFPKEHVLSIWKDELDVTRQWGGMVTTVLHPQVSGRPMRLGLLREFLTYALVQGDIWIATGQEIAAHFRTQEAADPAAIPVEPVAAPTAQVAPPPVPDAVPDVVPDVVPDAVPMLPVVVAVDTPVDMPVDTPGSTPVDTPLAPSDAMQASGDMPPPAPVADPPALVVDSILGIAPADPALVPPAPDQPAPGPVAEHDAGPDPTPAAALPPTPTLDALAETAVPPALTEVVPTAEPAAPAAAIPDLPVLPAPAAPPPPDPTTPDPIPAASEVPVGGAPAAGTVLPPVFPPLAAPTQAPPPSSRLLRPPPPPPPLSPRPPQRFGLFGRTKP